MLLWSSLLAAIVIGWLIHDPILGWLADRKGMTRVIQHRPKHRTARRQNEQEAADAAAHRPV